ncbi:hypothetical protein FK220_016370 [Flavobacteriaceae bacterium TP-CH-4]|uniref:Uncharacterized protein n=1 Tax=Pelagihabitans pacificus TaxID=2696054 RepID=A0A967AV32_9FLAO|nr:hypothetical protein [Pelagihabitans pacificus]NHF60929.1 hypothetical protein [Pelagihabitans pacificus]
MKGEEKSPAQEPTGARSSHWLQRLKDESWEAELLVSAIATFGTFQLFDVVFWATYRFIDLLPPKQYPLGYFIVISGLLAVSILVSMFVIHFFLRAFWVGLVGLNSVFPDYSLEDSAYSKIYTEKILSILPKQEETIQKVDELCSVIFAAAFCLLLIYAYLAITLSIYLFAFNVLSEYIPKELLLIPIGAIALLFIIQTVMGIVGNLKIFKENVIVQTWMYRIVRVGSMAMYGPLYKILLQITMTFGSNFKKKKPLIGLLLLFLFCGMVVSVVMGAKSDMVHLVRPDRFYKDTVYKEYYRNQNGDSGFLLTPEIDSDVIESKVLKLFIPIYGNERKYQEKICGPFEEDENRNQDENTRLIRAQYLDCYQQYNQIFVDEVRIRVDFIKQNHPETGQFGVICYLDTGQMNAGKNVLRVKKKFEKEVVSEWSIPFYLVPEASVSLSKD